jgi:hypothetical protein
MAKVGRKFIAQRPALRTCGEKGKGFSRNDVDEHGLNIVMAVPEGE